MSRLRNVVLVAVFFCLGAGLPFSIFGMPLYIGTQVASFLILASVVIWVLAWFLRQTRLDLWQVGVCAWVLLCALVSMISNTLIFRQGMNQWVMALYVLMPLVVIFPFKLAQVRFGEAIDGLIIVGFLAAMLVVIDQFHRIAFLDAYQRGAAADQSLRRIVFAKTEMVFAWVVCFARLLHARSHSTQIRYGGALITVGYALFVVSEGRLAIGATLIGCAIYLVFFYRSSRKVLVISTLSVVAPIALWLVLEKYIRYLGSVGNMQTNDVSVAFRLVEYQHFKMFFDQTHGIGFGIMAGGGSNNILGFARQGAGHAHTSGDFGLELADIGLFAALFQFGYAGLLFVIFMTIAVVRKLWKAGSANSAEPNRVECGAIAAVTIGFLLSPLPMNFFSLSWTMEYGGMLWFLASLAIASRVQVTGTTVHVPQLIESPLFK